MNAIKLFLVSFFILCVSIAHADGENIGPAFRAYGDYCEVWAGDEWSYLGSFFVQHSNGKKGHATFKCKMDLNYGDPQIAHFEWTEEGQPVAGGTCSNTIDLEGAKGMWTAQCFGAFNSGD